MGGSKSRKSRTEPKTDRIRKHMSEAVKLISSLSDSEIAETLGTGLIDSLLRAILDPSKLKEGRRIADIFLENKLDRNCLP